MNGADTATPPADAARLLRRFECMLVVLVLLLVAAHGRDDAWPFVVWPMYARGYPPPPPRVSETELRLVSRDGAVFRLLAADLFTPVEVDLGRRVAAGAFTEQPSAAGYRRAILSRLRPLLEARGVVEIEGWTLSWTPQPTAVPPLDLARPEDESLLGRMRVSSDGTSAPEGR
jgi:hypothetical protein